MLFSFFQDWCQHSKAYYDILFRISAAGRQPDTFEQENNEESDLEVQQKMFESVKDLSLLFNKGVPLSPPGRTDRELAAMSVDNHSPRILEMLLSAGVPLYRTDGRHSILEQSWLTMTSTTKEAVMVNRVSKIYYLFVIFFLLFPYSCQNCQNHSS